ncbi:MAG: DUF4301 family protein [Bacteroidales bacterium]|nr:DUF4301 family protein [Bacteroidales bacterium]
MFTEKDIQQIKSKNITIEDIEIQLQNFKNGFPFVNISRPATKNDGMLVLSNEEVEAYQKLYEDLLPSSLKFVPASGAATRMFKFLFEFYQIAQKQYNCIEDVDDLEVITFFKGLKDFAFYNGLTSILKQNNLQIDILIAEGRYKEILKFFLFESGLNYGQKPKGVLAFHKYGKNVRTAFEEHLIEGANYAKSADGKVSIHFTISEEHSDLFKNILIEKKNAIEKEYNVSFDISFSQQKSSTDIIAVNLNNDLFRNIDGSLLFRPGGHGALIENLNELKANVIFIKNIDNVVSDKLQQTTIEYKKVLAGILVSFQEKIFNYLNAIENDEITPDMIPEIVLFIEKDLCCNFSSEPTLNDLFNILNRPIRVCGMVKNEGEPGGGPFWVKQKTGVENLQIVESAQINHSNSEVIKIVQSATYFNPVDLVCSTIDYKGNKFDLLNFRDSSTGFISKKSKDGKELKAQELPGLWNGAMANWNTIFVEVPILTFNPVKTVNDLLRPAHQ